MNTKNTPKFIDSPCRGQLIFLIDKWQKPEIPDILKKQIPVMEQITFRELSVLFRKKLNSRHVHFRKQIEKSITDWLYALIRLNVKRGRVFDLREALKTGYADCLGYAKIFTALGRYSGINAGMIEIIIDNRGRNVPHTATLVKFADGRFQFIDFWYGSKDIKHKRLGLSVKHSKQWQIEDIDYKDLRRTESISYLPDYCVDAITLYVRGNGFLKKGDYIEAIRQYSEAIRLFPQNARIFYNRAIAYENLHELKSAKEDYVQALQDNISISRTLATQPEDIVELMRLDEQNITENAQHMYLLHKGFITGKKVPPVKIAREMGLSVREIEGILNSIKTGAVSN